jgi:ABC-2 type transport system ATP-binding protein
VIKVENIVKDFKTTKAVDNVTFSVKKGEIFGFLGPNGAGKSTIIKMLTARLKATSGSILIANFDTKKDRDKIHRIIGVVPEIQNLYDRMSARENLNIFAKLYNTDLSKVDVLLKRFELFDRADDKIKNFSFGMKQRILLARGLLSEPQIIFMDEPTKGLDPHTARYIREVIKEENEKGVTIFLTTHYMEEAEYLSDRIAIIDKGKIVALDTTKNLKTKQNSVKVFLKIAKNNNNYEIISLEEEEDRNTLKTWLDANEVLSIESNEETLEDVFIRLTGRKLV